MTIELKGLSREQVTNLLPEGLILLGWRGSVAHGMYVPKSDPDSIDDKDVMGIYIAPIEHYLGFGRKDVYEKWAGEWDCVFYELRKFIGLLLQCNPNVLSLLWLKDNGIIYESPLGQLLRDHRDLFVTKKAYHSFSGYAHAQFKKMISSIRKRRRSCANWSIGCWDSTSIRIQRRMAMRLRLPAGSLSSELRLT